jgi:PAS domain S-box-containing protein
MNIEYFNNLANELAGRVNISSNSGLTLIIAAAVVLLMIVFLIVSCVLSAKKRKYFKKCQTLESHMNALNEVSPDMLVCKDNAGVFLKCNDAFSAFAGVPEPQLINRTITDITGMSERLCDEILAADRKAISEGMTVKIRKTLVFPDGSSKLHESIRTPVLRKKGGSSGILCIFRDLSELSEVQQKNEEMSVKIAELEKIAQRDIDFENQINAKSKEIETLKADLLSARKSAFCLKTLRSIAAMGGALSDDNLPLYADYVIAIKEDATKIGAEELAKRAADLENAVDYQNRDFIKEHHPDFIGELSKTLGELDAEANAKSKQI